MEYLKSNELISSITMSWAFISLSCAICIFFFQLQSEPEQVLSDPVIEHQYKLHGTGRQNLLLAIYFLSVCEHHLLLHFWLHVPRNTTSSHTGMDSIYQLKTIQGMRYHGFRFSASGSRFYAMLFICLRLPISKGAQHTIEPITLGLQLCQSSFHNRIFLIILLFKLQHLFFHHINFFNHVLNIFSQGCQGHA